MTGSVYMAEKAEAEIREQKIARIEKELDNVRLHDGVLDDLVYDILSKQASTINNLGPAEQINFILDELGDVDGEEEILKLKD